MVGQAVLLGLAFGATYGAVVLLIDIIRGYR